MPKGRFHLQGTLINSSPLSIGSGQGTATDSDILRDAKGQPYIPATSFMGVLKDMARQYLAVDETFDRFFGQDALSGKRDAWGSAIDCADLELAGNKAFVSVRDGIKIDPKTGLVEDGAKYDYQIVEPGTTFKINLVLRYNSAVEQVFAERLVGLLIQVLESQDFYLGSKSNKGMGRMSCQTDLKVVHYDFASVQDVFAWFERSKQDAYRPQVDFPKQGRQSLSIRAYVKIDNALMVRAFPHQQEDNARLPDSIQLQAGGQPVLPGSSLRGALRHRALKIVNTLGLDPQLLTQMFGDVNEAEKTACKGHLRIQETQLKNTVLQQQTRIRVDRFTGGTIDSGLFQVMPVFQQQKDESYTLLEMNLTSYLPEEAGLLMLLLKDLFTGQLAVGGEKNIGRGRFIGQRATITWRDAQESHEIELTDFKKLTQDEQDKLQHFVAVLQEKKVGVGV